MRIAYDKLFNVSPDGSVGPRASVHINGVTMGPGVRFGGGVQFGGVDLAALRGRDLEVEEQNGVYVLKGAY